MLRLSSLSVTVSLLTLSGPSCAEHAALRTRLFFSCALLMLMLVNLICPCFQLDELETLIFKVMFTIRGRCCQPHQVSNSVLSEQTRSNCITGCPPFFFPSRAHERGEAREFCCRDTVSASTCWISSNLFLASPVCLLFD